MGRIRDYISKWLERKIVDPLYVMFSAKMDARLEDDKKRLETSIEDHKTNAKADLASVVGSASAGLNIDFQNLKSNFGILNTQFDKFVREVDSKIAEFIEVNASKIDEAVNAVNSSVQTSAGSVSTAVASYNDARAALEEMKTSFETARTELLELQTEYKLDYAAFQAAAKSVQNSIAGLEAKVSGWENKAGQLLSVDLTEERLEAAHESGERLLNSIKKEKEGIKDAVLASVRTELSADIASAVKTLSESMRTVADERAYNMLVYCLNIPDNKRSIVCWVADYNGNFEPVRKQLKDGGARSWLNHFEQDVKENHLNLKYLSAIVKLLGYRQK